MGIQTLMAAFADNEDGERSIVSQRFMTVDEINSGMFTGDVVETGLLESGRRNEVGQARRKRLLRARTITIVNGDYPLASFINDGFNTLRRVCDVITVVGNRKDAALLWSEVGNGFMYTLDTKFNSQSQPSHMRIKPHFGDPETGSDETEGGCTNDRDSYCSILNCSKKQTDDEMQGKDRAFARQLTIGKEIYGLYASKTKRELELAIQNGDPWKHGLHYEEQNLSISGLSTEQRERYHRSHRRWLDLDAIDTTWMDTNVHFIRHNYFNLNPVLMEDLRELILTGRRASERSLLLHREGNIYSYCQAPSCVVNK
mmetsp:Transcript_11509/g.13945  ORF Transcript_11509/g.13945 Transcript_11509/m.13945 type:complete len:314 (-) Transcript_11509:813-1754(-)